MRFSFDDFVLDDTRYELSRGGVVLKIDSQVLELLAHLAKSDGRLVSKQELLDEVWQGRALGDNVISVCVAKLRKALGDAGHRCIGSVYGRGYRLLVPVTTLAESGRSSAPPPSAALSEAPRLVGREQALARLRHGLERALSGESGAFALFGEAGIGKTRSAEALQALAHEAGAHVSWGRCDALGDAPALWPWLQVVRSCEGILATELGAEHVAPRSWAQLAPSAEEPRAQVWSPRALDLWPRTLDWIDRVLDSVLAQRTWLIVLDDAQWADAASLELLAHVLGTSARRAGRGRHGLFLLLTVRDTDPPHRAREKRALEHVLGHPNCERIELGRLQASDVGAYVTSLFGAPLPELARAVFERSEGNPFFMVELLRPFSPGPAPAPSELGLPDSARGILRQTLARLAPAVREALASAALIGREFDLGLLAAVTACEPGDLLDMLGEAMASHVIVAAPDSRTSFGFGHDLLREVVAEELPPRSLARAHASIAQALIERSAAASEIAHHLVSALPSGDATQAVLWAERAASAAAGVGAYADAAQLLRRALDALHLAPNPHKQAALTFAMAACERAAGEPRFIEHFEQAVTLARTHAIADVLVAAGQSMSVGPGTLAMPGASAVLEAALAALPQEDASSRVAVLSHLSWTAPTVWSESRVAALMERARALLPQARSSGRAAFEVAELYRAGGPDTLDDALALAAAIERNAAALEPAQRARASIEPLIARMLVHLQRGNLSAAERAIEDFGVVARELHHAELIWHHERMRAVSTLNRGAFAEARELLGALKQTAERLQLHAHKAVSAIDFGVLTSQTSDVTPFASELAAAFAPSAADAPSTHAYKLRALVQLGLLDDARAALSALPPATIRELPKHRYSLAALAHLAYASAATRSLAHAAVLYELLAPYPTLCVASLSFHCYGTVAHFLGLLSRAQGNRTRAIGHFEEALALHDELGFAAHVARTRFELGETLHDAGDGASRGRARTLFARTCDEARALGMQPLAELAQQRLGAR